MMVLDRKISWGIAVTTTQNRVHTEGIKKEDADDSKKDWVEMSSHKMMMTKSRGEGSKNYNRYL